jgi:hypothetical protein
VTNAVLIPRSASCWVCKNVPMVEDVTVRLFDENGRRGRGSIKAAVDYLRSIGLDRSEKLLRWAIARHIAHVEQALAGPTIAPSVALTRIAPEGGPARWLDVNQQAMDVGMDALRSLHARLPDMADRELVAVARMGMTASHKHGDWEAKGRKLAQVDAIIRLAAGLSGGTDAEGE